MKTKSKSTVLHPAVSAAIAIPLGATAVGAAITFLHASAAYAVAVGLAISAAALVYHNRTSRLLRPRESLDAALTAITDLFIGSSDTSKFLRDICRYLTVSYRVESTSIWTLRPTGLEVDTCYPDFPQPSQFLAYYGIDTPVVAECTQSGNCVTLVPPDQSKHSPRRILIVPLPHGGLNKAVVMVCEDYSRVQASLSEILPALHAAMAALHSGFWKENVRAELRKMRPVSDIMCNVGPQASTSEVRDAVVDASVVALETPCVSIMNIDPYTGDVEYGYTEQVSGQMREAFLEISGDVLTDRSIEEPRVVVLPDNEQEHSPAQADLYREGIRSLLACPIRSNVGAMGALVAFYPTADGSAEKAHLIEAVAVQASAMISFALAIEQSRTLLDELAGVNHELSVQATVDGLTGLVNHRTFQQRLSEMCSVRSSARNALFSLIMVDVDHFKLFNDTYGHQEGDEVLSGVARVLSSRMRQSDFAARYGGEEFALVIKGVGKQDVLPVAERIRRAISEECKSKATITVSMGVAEFPADGRAPDEIIECADKALYHAKVTGRNRVIVWGSTGCEMIGDELPPSDIQTPVRNVLVVESPEQDAEGFIRGVLESGDYALTIAHSPADATECLRTRSYDVALVTSQALGDGDLKMLSSIASVHPHMPTILVTSEAHTSQNREALRKGASDVVFSPFSSAELPLVIERNLERRRLERNKLTQRSTGLMLQPIDALVAAVDSRDHYTVGHTDQVTALSLGIADQLKVSQEERAALELAAKLHDVGKLALPDSALNKDSQLTEEEWSAMRQHPIMGSRIVGAIHELAYVSTIIRHHHERLDGTGYPDGLRGQAIPYLSRVIAVADAYEAMTSDRSHRNRMTTQEAIAELRRCAGRHYAPEVVDALEAHLKASSGDTAVEAPKAA